MPRKVDEIAAENGVDNTPKFPDILFTVIRCDRRHLSAFVASVQDSHVRSKPHWKATNIPNHLHIEFPLASGDGGGVPQVTASWPAAFSRSFRETDERRVRMRMLIADDDSALGTFLQRGFEAEGYQAQLVTDGAAAVEAFRDQCPEITILDLNLPKKDGECALHEMRNQDADLPILILTGRQDLQSRVRCLESGADDFVVKPFSFAELRARCKTLLRRNRCHNTLLRSGDLEVNRMDRSVKRGSESVVLTNKEFALLEQLMLHRGNCLSRLELLQRVWKQESSQTTNIVDVYVNYLRRKLDDHPPGSIIRTLHGKGYMIPIASGIN